jgi:triacylglycerol lipase
VTPGPPAAPAAPATLLVPGWSDTARSLKRARDHLLAAGWPPAAVAVADFRDRYGSNAEHAEEIGEAVARLRQRTGARRVAVVAHSMGGLALRHYLGTAAGADSVATAIFVGTPHRGSWLAWLAWGRGGAEMRPGSPFLRQLEATRLPPHVRAVCLSTPFETRVIPGSSALLDGAECRVVRRPTHPRMMRHRATLDTIRRILLEAAAPTGAS